MPPMKLGRSNPLSVTVAFANAAPIMCAIFSTTFLSSATINLRISVHRAHDHDQCACLLPIAEKQPQFQLSPLLFPLPALIGSRTLSLACATGLVSVRSLDLPLFSIRRRLPKSKNWKRQGPTQKVTISNRLVRVSPRTFDRFSLRLLRMTPNAQHFQKHCVRKKTSSARIIPSQLFLTSPEHGPCSYESCLHARYRTDHAPKDDLRSRFRNLVADLGLQTSTAAGH